MWWDEERAWETFLRQSRKNSLSIAMLIYALNLRHEFRYKYPRFKRFKRFKTTRGPHSEPR